MAFSVRNLTFKYPHAEVAACEDFNLEAEDGDLVAILGCNGTGKSTLLRLLAGLERPSTPDGRHGNARTQMEISGNQKAIVQTDTRTWRACLTQHASLVFQQYSDVIFEWQKVDEAMTWVRPEKDDYFVNVVSLFPALTLPAGDVSASGEPEPLTEFRYWGQLSGGQKQALALARGLLRDPDLLLLDEPFASIDASLRYQVELSLVKIHATQGKKHRVTVLVTHDIDQAVFLANRILIVDGPPLRVVHEVISKTPLEERGTKYRLTTDFLDTRQQVFELFFNLPSNVQATCSP